MAPAAASCLLCPPAPPLNIFWLAHSTLLGVACSLPPGVVSEHEYEPHGPILAVCTPWLAANALLPSSVAPDSWPARATAASPSPGEQSTIVLRRMASRITSVGSTSSSSRFQFRGLGVSRKYLFTAFQSCNLPYATHWEWACSSRAISPGSAGTASFICSTTTFHEPMTHHITLEICFLRCFVGVEPSYLSVAPAAPVLPSCFVCIVLNAVGL